MIGVLLMLDVLIVLTLVVVTAGVGRADPFSGWRYTLTGGTLALLAAVGTWVFDLPRWAYVVAGLVVAAGVFLGLGADLIRLSRPRQPVPPR